MGHKERLIDELVYNANVSQDILEQRLADTAAWFFSNKDRIPRDNLASRQAFLEKTCWLLIEINALLLERIRKSQGGSHLWLPRGLNAQGDVRKFG